MQKIKSPYKSRKYLIRLLLSVTLLIVILLSALSAALYIHTERTVLNIQQSASEKMLAQTVYNLDSMNELLKTTAIAAYYDSFVSDFLYGDVRDTYALFQHIPSLEKVMKAAPFLHSIVLFNELHHCYYSYSPSAIQACQTDTSSLLTARYIEEQPSIPKLKLLPVSAVKKSGVRQPIDFFSFAMFSDRVLPPGERKGMLILNVHPDWLFAQLNGINSLNDYGDSQLLLMSSSGESYDPGLKSWSSGGDLYSSLLQAMNTSDKNADLFIEGSGPNKQIVSFMKSEKYDWTVVSLQPYEQVFHDILRMKAVSFYIIAAFLLLALTASAGLTFRLYHPVEILLRKVRANVTDVPTDPAVTRKDEWAYLSTAFQHTLDQVHQMSRNQDDQNSILRTYYSKKIMLESATMSLHEIQDLIRHYQLNISTDLPFLLVGFHSDDYKRPDDPTFSTSTQALQPKIISNVVNSVLSDEYKHELMDMGNGCLVDIITLTAPDELIDTRLMQRITAIQTMASLDYNLSLTLTVSSTSEQVQDISNRYEQILDYANYRIIRGRMSIITHEHVEANLRSEQFLSSPELEKRLSEGLKSGHREVVNSCLEVWFRGLHALKYEQMLFGMFHLLATVHKVVEEMNANRLQQIAFDTRELYSQLASIATLHDAECLFRDTLSDITSETDESSADSTNQLVIDTVQEIVLTRYADPNLCLPEIASMVRLSSAHISKLFKQKNGVGIPEYITEVRLQHTLSLLKRQEHSVNQIMEMVGFTNQSYFFRLFKKKFGTTPKEYRLKQVL